MSNPFTKINLVFFRLWKINLYRIFASNCFDTTFFFFFISVWVLTYRFMQIYVSCTKTKFPQSTMRFSIPENLPPSVNWNRYHPNFIRVHFHRFKIEYILAPLRKTCSLECETGIRYLCINEPKTDIRTAPDLTLHRVFFFFLSRGADFLPSPATAAYVSDIDFITASDFFTLSLY